MLFSKIKGYVYLNISKIGILEKTIILVKIYFEIIFWKFCLWYNLGIWLD